MTNIARILMLIAIPFLSACDKDMKTEYSPQFSDTPVTVASKIRYVFGVHPLHNPQRLHDVFEPLMNYLSMNVPNAEFVLEASRNYAAYDKKLYAKKFDFGLPNPFQTVNAIGKGYKVFAKMGDDENFRGIILVRKDSGINSPADLIGKAVSYPAPTALAATMMPQYYLQTHGVNVMSDLDNRYVGSQESSIMNVYLGDTAAGSTWPPPWIALSKERPELARELKVIWETKPLPNNGLVVLPTVSKEVVNQVQSLLINLHKSDEGKVILERIILSRFEAADDGTYQPVRDFIVTFSNSVRQLN